MVKEVMRFFKTAQQDLAEHNLADETLGEYLDRHQFGREFIEHHLIPMGAAIWSTPCEEMMLFPAQSFIQFFQNHGLLSVNDRPQWRTVAGGSSTYIKKMKRHWNNVEICTEARLAGIRRDSTQVHLDFAGGSFRSFDRVIIATHADQARRLLLDSSDEETKALSCWSYSKSRTILHTDESVMPPLRKVWSSWNFQRLEGARTSLTYHMNRLQGLETEKQYFVSLNLPMEPKGIIREFNYEHPMFTREALVQRMHLKQLNGKRNTWFAGSYFGNGFHEDAVRSGVEVAKDFGIEL